MRKPMDRADRAKQFMPFAALEGLDSALQRRTRQPQPRIILAEDAQAELDEKLRSLSLGDTVTATHYAELGYVDIHGSLRRIDHLARSITVDEVEIKLSDLLDISKACP